MNKLIWKNWLRHKQRFILLLAGIMIISSGLTYLSTLTESNVGTVTDTLEKKWKASYDIVVRPPGTRSVTEEQQLFEPNFLSGISGGISVEQYEWIKTIADVDIAAPLAVMGYADINIFIDKLKLRDSGVYRYQMEILSNSGVNEEKRTFTNYFTIGPWSAPDTTTYLACSDAYLVCRYYEDVMVSDQRLLVGIDPQEEARLVGLDQAVVPLDNSRYFRENDVSIVANPSKSDPNRSTRIPLLVSSQPFADTSITYRIERLDVPFGTAEEARETMEGIRESGYAGMEKTPKHQINEKQYDSKKMYEVFVGSLTGINPYTGDTYENDNASINSVRLVMKPPSLQMSKTVSPFAEKWKHAFQINPVSNNTYGRWNGYSFRSIEEYQVQDQLFPGHLIRPSWVGFYDPNKLNISKDPTSETPLETYRSSVARLVLDPNGKPVNPPGNMQATANPLGVLTSPPSLLTTIDAATKVLGDKAISSVRVKVAGVDDLSTESQAKVEKVAHDIERETGLIVDILMGSSPQPVLIDVPASKNSPALGWIEQTWIKIGEKTTLFNETQIGFSVIMLLILLVAVLYVQATQLVSLLMRRREFAVLLAVGWRPSRLKRMIVQEAAMLGLFAAFVSGALGLAIWINRPESVDPFRIALFAALGLVIYVLGSLWPAWLSGKIRPFETMRTGEIVKSARRIIKTRGITSMALNHFLGKMGRYTLSIISIALPTALLVLLLFITFRLKGVLYTSWIGQYVSVEIGPQHYVAIVVTLIICVLTTGELIWQNITERKPELFLLKSIGWRSGAVRRLILFEGWVCGLVSGIVGYLIGFAITLSMYGKVPWEDALLLLPACVIPMIVGLIAAWVPAEFAVRGFPAGTTRTIYSSSRRGNRWLFAAASVFGLIVLLIGGKAAFDYISKLSAEKQDTAVVTNMIKEAPVTIGKPKDFVPQTVPNGSKAAYDLTISMDQQGRFMAKAVIDVSNVSEEAWDKLVFYMIPNVFTEANKPEFIKSPGDFRITQVNLNGKETSYDLRYDTLSIPLSAQLQQGGQAKVEVIYEFSPPEHGPRFSKTDGNYYLAQFYPMLANYNHGWNKEDYIPQDGTETYHTDFTDIRVNYTLPEGYTIVSSANDEPDITPSSGTIEANRVKEMFIAIVKDTAVRKKAVGGTELRVFGKISDIAKVETSLENAVSTFTYLEQTIGVYPRKQLDIFVAEGGMEYPGIVTITPSDSPDYLEKVLAHEIAHQWFYGVVSSDPYHAAFLDEGFTEFSAALYLMDHKGYPEESSFMQSSTVSSNRMPSNLPLNEYGKNAVPYFYVQAPQKLWELFSKYEGFSTAKAYLKAYYDTYAFKEVDAKEFIRFTKAYFLMQDDSFFKSWLKL